MSLGGAGKWRGFRRSPPMPLRTYFLDVIGACGLGFCTIAAPNPPMSSMKTMDASKVRQSLPSVLQAVRDREEVIVILRYGRAVAALVPLDRLSRVERESVGGGGVTLRDVGRKRPPA